MLGVVNDVVPVPPDNTVPPVDAAYQSTVSPADTVTLIFTVPVPVLEPSTGDVGADGNGGTVIVAVAEFAAEHAPLVTTAL